MGVKIKKVTGKDIYEAIEQDGFGAMRGQWFEKSSDGKIRACLLGTAALNLSVTPHDGINSLVGQLNKYFLSPDNPWYTPLGPFQDIRNGVGNTIMDEFDRPNDVEDTITSLACNKFEEWNYQARTIKEYREEIIKEYDFDKEYIRSIDGMFYSLPTWEDALKMAKEVLQTVWDEVFEIQEYDFETDFSEFIPHE